MTWTISDVISQTFRSFARNWVGLVIGSLVMTLIVCIPIVVSGVALVPALAKASGEGGSQSVELGGSIIVLVLGFVSAFVLCIMFAPALSRMALAAARGERVRIRDVFDFRRAGTFFGAGLLTGLAVMAGALLLVVPGIIVAIALSLVSFFVVDQPALGATDALDASWQATRGHRLHLFGFMILGGLASAVLQGIFGLTVWFAPLQLGLALVSTPISTLAMAHLYLRLKPPPRAEVQALAA